MKKSHIALCASCLVLGGLLSGCKSAEERANEDETTRKVLMIGNSFSICLLSHLPQVAADRGVALDVGSLYIGGCTLQRHWANATNTVETFRPYAYDRIVRGKRIAFEAMHNLPEIVAGTKWDVITVQQGSHESWRPETYHPYGDNLIALIRRLAPQAKIYVQETWSYTPWDKRLAKWGIDQNEMFAKLHGAYGAFAKQHGLEVIPFGSAVQEWRRRLPVKYAENSLGGDVVGGGYQEARDQFKRAADGKWVPNCDVFHLGRRGEYFQALVWAKTLFDVDLENLGYKPDFVSDSDQKLMKDIAMGRK